MDITTIKVYKKTKERLDKLKEYEKESYEQILRKMLFILNVLKKDSEKARETLKKIDSRAKRKRVY